MTTSCNECQNLFGPVLEGTCSVLRWKRQWSSHVDVLKIEKTTFGRQLKELQYEYEDALAKGKMASDALKKLRASIDKFVSTTSSLVTKRQLTLIGSKRTCGRAFLHSWKARKCHERLGEEVCSWSGEKCYVNFAVVHDILQAIETVLSHLGPSFNLID